MADCLDSACTGLPSCAIEVTAVEMLCNDGGDNDSNGQTDCADARCTWACTALMTACTGGNKLRAYKLAPLPQGIPDVSSVSATVAVTQTGTIVLAAVRFDAVHTFDADIDLTMTSPGAVVRDLTSDNGSLNENYVGTVFLDAAPTSITAGSAPFTGNFQPEAPLSGWTGQSITGTWSSTLTDDLGSDTGTWNDLSIALCVSP
jgi:subtilisin-like proprotein convertase family protein